jgi:aminoglycoside 3-N-acetyltransferase
MAVHDLDCHHGERSPLRWLYDRNAAVALLGVGYAACTAFHLAEYRVPGELPWREYHCFTLDEGRRTARTFTDIDLIDADFDQLGKALEAASWPDPAAAPRSGQVGRAPATLLPIRTAVDFAVSWLPLHRRT